MQANISQALTREECAGWQLYMPDEVSASMTMWKCSGNISCSWGTVPIPD